MKKSKEKGTKKLKKVQIKIYLAEDTPRIFVLVDRIT